MCDCKCCHDESSDVHPLSNIDLTCLQYVTPGEFVLFSVRKITRKLCWSFQGALIVGRGTTSSAVDWQWVVRGLFWGLSPLRGTGLFFLSLWKMKNRKKKILHDSCIKDTNDLFILTIWLQMTSMLFQMSWWSMNLSVYLNWMSHNNLGWKSRYGWRWGAWQWSALTFLFYITK